MNMFQMLWCVHNIYEDAKIQEQMMNSGDGVKSQEYEADSQFFDEFVQQEKQSASIKNGNPNDIIEQIGKSIAKG
jgi:hypothetical protein